MKIKAFTLFNRDSSKTPFDIFETHPEFKHVFFITIETDEDLPGYRINGTVTNNVTVWETLIPGNEELYKVFFPYRKYIKCERK